MKYSWREGSKTQLPGSGEQYYPAVLRAIGEAWERIVSKMFIQFKDDAGK